jgi:hypothetical protein
MKAAMMNHHNSTQNAWAWWAGGQLPMRCLFVMPTCGKSNEGTGKKVGTFSSRHPLLRPCAHVAPQRTMKEKTMSLLVLHMDKFKKDAVRGIQSHNRRERESHSNPDID